MAFFPVPQSRQFCSWSLGVIPPYYNSVLGVEVPFVTMSPSLLPFSVWSLYSCAGAVWSAFSSFSGELLYKYV